MSGSPFHRTEAICLRVIDYSETSQILRFYARDSGKISCIAKGAKRKKSTFRGAFHFLAVYNLVRMEKMSGSLDLVTQAELIEDFHALAEDFSRYSTACYIAEFLDTFTLDGQVVRNLYEITSEALHRLQKDVPLPDLLFSFESKALRALGFFPRLRECGGCRNTITTTEAYFAPRDGGVICLRCRPRDQKRFLVRRAALESLVHFGEGDMPREPIKKWLVDALRTILDTVITYQLERTLRSSRFVRRALLESATLEDDNPSTRVAPTLQKGV
ncbi:MAG: DNA repair protein RecO [Planctomycetota bacterium]|nr:DNA repair protein RecO [Planctomycetota bacterium]